MLCDMMATGGLLAAGGLSTWLYNSQLFVYVLIGFSIIIFFHELGHFLAAKWVGVRVDRFAVGFGPRVCGWRSGEGFTFGSRPDYNAAELARRGYGETDYCLKLLPVGGYVKMLGEDDVIIDDDTGEMRLSDDPRAFTSRPVGQRMIVVSAGVVFNLLLAVVLLTWVYLAGKSVIAPVVGPIMPDSPVYGKLLPGDEIVSIDGRRVRSFKDVIIGGIVGGDEVRVRVKRDGVLLPDEIVVPTEFNPAAQLRVLNIPPAISLRLAKDGRPVDGLPALKKGDVLTHVEGRPIRSMMEVYDAFAASDGKPVRLTVERTDPDNPDAPPKSVECYARPVLRVAPSALRVGRPPTPEDADSAHILGFRRLQEIVDVVPGEPAEQAGMRPGDVILRWGTVANPTYSEIVKGIHANPGREVPVTVLRDGQTVDLTVTPTAPASLFGESKPRIGAMFENLFGYAAEPIVADVAPDTPAAALQMPRGSRIVAIDDAPMSNWADVVRALLASAGREVRVRYRSGPDEAVGEMHVPSSLVNELDLPQGAVVWSVNGRDSIRVAGADGEPVELSIVRNAVALRELLRELIGKTVTVRVSPTLSSPPQEMSFTVREDNYDPWQMRVAYVYPDFQNEERRVILSANGNPFVACWMGIMQVKDTVYEVYAFLRLLIASRNTGVVKQVSGPVGIVGAAVDQAKAGFVELLSFMAFLSINLAVINFLPIPVMDGGLMVFLLIEKIKGKPLSLKTQMVSTLVGLAAIILIALLVTFQDISRLIG
ncbi:MAG: PDZ domain-containing protein [Planctomycetota bacterium]|nr:MAG: PDZ domain-containing protein [Planctomycetota bacterium]